MIQDKLKPISILNSSLYFLISSILIYLGLYIFTPLLLVKGIPFLWSYLIFFHIPLFLLLITGLIFYKFEGNNWNWREFKERVQLKKMSRRDWLWAVGLLFFGILVYVGFSPIGNILAKLSFFRPPDFFPAEINPNKKMIYGLMMDYRLSGQYWVIIVYFFAWVTNILGEEFLFRGILFPRQIKRYGRIGWIYHGLIWTLWHFFWKWNLVSILPFAMALSFTMYKRQNLWITIFAHGLMNVFPLIIIIIEVFN